MQRALFIRWAAPLAIAAAALAPGAHAQDAKAWLESQGLEGGEVKTFEDYEVFTARVKGAKDATDAAERVVVLKQGKPVWQSTPKDADPGSRWTVHSVGRDLDGDGAPDAHFSSYSGGPHCCTAHHIYRLKPQVKKTAGYSSGNVGASDFVELPGRKTPVMVSADDSSATAFAPYANSYFPVVILEVAKGKFQFARDLMQSKLPGQPPPVCTQPAATANPWLRERCAEYVTSRRQSRTTDIKTKLADIKSGRAAEKLKWEDYYATGVLASVSAEMNRYAYTGHGSAGYNWLETIWPGNDAVKVKFIQTLRQVQGKSSFAEDLKAIATN